MTEETTSPTSTPLSRRAFLGGAATVAGAAGLAAYLPLSVQRAMAASPVGRFDLRQVKHVVYLMMENRSFDHYFGLLPGVRGFADPRAGRLPNGSSVFRQPDPDNPDGFLEPFHLDTITTGAAAVPSLSHDWRIQHASYNGGAMDGWLRAHTASDSDRSGPFTMGYYDQADIPFHYALAQSFTVCDNYFCSVLGPTHPNRYLWQTGTNDPQGLSGGPALDNNATPGTYRWVTPAEMLTNQGYTWKCYQQADNFGTNMLEMFAQFINAPANSVLHQGAFSISTLFGDGTPGGIGDPTNPTPASDPAHAFEEDCANGTIPDVSWIHTTSVASEHPSFLPAAGAQFIASILEALAANTELWNSTVLILDYDENDGFFDHVTPPAPNEREFPEEFVHLPSPGGTPGGGLPVGGGFRVPAFIISPWTVNPHAGRSTQVFSGNLDHTSGLQFLERVTAAGGLNLSGGKGGIRTLVSNFRRHTFGDFTELFERFNRPEPAPMNNQFEPATTAANLAAQTTASMQPLPPFPGGTQSFGFARP